MAQAKKRVIAVSGCKGGVGKTVVSVNLALALTKLGQRVVLMDGNLSVPDVEFTLGMNKNGFKGHLSSSKNFSSIGDDTVVNEIINPQQEGLLDGPLGVKVFTPAAQEEWKDNIQIVQAVELIQGMDDLASDLDTLIIDTAPGLAPDNVTLIQAATEVLVVISQEDLSVVDAVRQIELLYRVFNVHQFYIVVNLVSGRRGGAKQFEKLQQYLKDDKQIVLRYLGAIPYDKTVSESVLKQSAVLSVSDDSRAARAFHRIGHKLSKLPVPEPKGRIEFFLPGRIKERI
ncbi:P-loop NTPase [Endozoicomonas sp. SCSIO W0465]|uniref:MinD/ParA family ATP-binding protein n=1 Tax=Endozoicomonas sp. SCSIO W0465 TaxID=2918516 RepID=UPI00207502CB|nr:P-loop NTPase [Endozoicomonas sp. SCSIO W0465]USE38603.1 P-loop NTPase [Endozoicomonas sp. SCSIO W0465]